MTRRQWAMYLLGFASGTMICFGMAVAPTLILVQGGVWYWPVAFGPILIAGVAGWLGLRLTGYPLRDRDQQ